jgi:predicted phage replisome organizer
MSEVKWIQIVTDVFDNRKIKQIERMPEGDAIIVVWFKILCLAGKCNKNGMIFFTDEIPYTERMLATEFGMEQPQRFNVLILALRTFEQFKMIEIIDNIFCISSWERYQNIAGLEKIREQNRLRQARYKENKKQLSDNVNSNVSDNTLIAQGNAIEIDKERNKEKYYKNNMQSNRISTLPKVSIEEVDLFFESIWKLYPNKKGRAQVSDAAKRILYGLGFDQLSVAIHRYQEELNKDSWRQAQNGSTFFTRGYLDYLDSNYQSSINKSSKQNYNRFNDFPQRYYTEKDYKEIENKLVNRSL